MISLIHAEDDSSSTLQMHLEDEDDTVQAGWALASALVAPLNIHLHGNLGAGKTTLVRAVLRELGYREKVKSPTYTLIELYVVSRLNLYHFDFYRFNSPEEYLEAGLDEYFSAGGICMVEWPDKAYPFVAAADLEIHLSIDHGGRDFKASPRTSAGITCIKKMLKALSPQHQLPR